MVGFAGCWLVGGLVDLFQNWIMELCKGYQLDKKLETGRFFNFDLEVKCQFCKFRHTRFMFMVFLFLEKLSYPKHLRSDMSDLRSQGQHTVYPIIPD